MPIILADAEKDYLVCLANRLTKCIPDLQLELCMQKNEIIQIIEQSNQRLLLIYNPVDFPDLRHHEIFISKKLECWTLVAGNLTSEFCGHTYMRIGSSAPLVAELRKYLIASEDLKQSDFVAQSVGHAQQNLRQLHFLCCAEPSGYRPDHSRKTLHDLVMSCDKVIYLPLMPTYQMSCISTPGSGLAISDLLLHLDGHDIRPEDLGQFLQPNPDGYLQFRPPDRSDDLVTCNPETMRNLVLLLRHYVRNSDVTAAALIDCAGLPFSLCSAIAVLCDTCQILLPERDCFATQAARRETGRLLAELPSECRIIGQNDSCAKTFSSNKKTGAAYDD